jgi:hypothetical protein
MKLPWRRGTTKLERLPSHPVTVSVSLRSGDIVIEGLDPQIELIAEQLAKVGIHLSVSSRGLCG